MRGMLSFQILWLLSKNELSGEKLAEEIMARRGEKPKAGTIYPALKELKERGMISGKKNGKEIIYSLTTLGKASLKESVRYFCRAFGEIFTSELKR